MIRLSVARVAATARRYGWTPILVLAAVQGLDNGERIALSQAVAGIRDRFEVTDTAVGLLPTAMVVSSIVGTFVLGWLADRLPRTRLLASVVALWALFLIASGGANAFTLLLVLQVGVGLLQAADPAALSLIGDYEALDHRARAMGVWQFGSFVGAMLGTLGGGLAVGLGGWRWAFWIWVPLGVVTVLALLRLPEPRRGEQDVAAALPAAPHLPGRPTPRDELAVASRSAAPTAGDGIDAGSVRELLSTPTFWIAIVGISIAQLLFIGLTFWGIEYLKRAFDLGPVAAGAGAAVLGLGAGAGVLLGGTWADRRLARGIRTARVQVAAVGSVASGILLALAFAAPTLVLAIPLLALGGMALTIPLGPSEALVLDVVPPHLRGRAAAVRTAARGVSGASPALIGVLSDALGLRAALVLSSPVLIVAGVILAAALRTYPADLDRALEVARERGVRTGS